MKISYEAFFDQSPIPSIVLGTDEAFTILSANKAFGRLTGWEPERLGDRSLAAIFQNESAAGQESLRQIRAFFRTTVEDPKPRHLPRHHLHISNAEGVPLVCEWDLFIAPLRTDDGAVTALMVQIEEIATCVKENDSQALAVHEIERLREQKDAADESAKLLQAIIDSAQAGIFLFAPVYDVAGELTDFRFRMANRMLSSYVGQQPEPLVGALGSTWFPGYKVNGLFEKYSDTFLNGSTNRFEFHYDNDGIDVWLDIMSTPVNGEVLVTFTDHTSFKMLQGRLEAHVEELRSSNASLEQFAYIASHDLQEPLRKIKAFGDMLNSRYQEALGESGSDLIGRMQNAASRMSHLIEDLLTYSRVSVKPARLEPLDTNKILEDILFDLERMIQQHKAEIIVENLVPVIGQETQIGQVFLNLITNALKFHHPDKPPKIHIESSIVTGRNSGLPVIADDAGRSFQLIRISDNGIGFDMQYRDKIFQIFQRLHGRTEYPGTGVGLSIVKKVIENHNGYIDAHSEPDSGATFSILLPAVG